MSRWGPEGPPNEAYSRVTNPERYAPLHDIASALLDRLESEFDVESATGYGLDAELENQELARPSRRLRPRAPGAASIVIAFTAFPGVAARFGAWHTEGFPDCGCDACDESVGEAVQRLEQIVLAVTTGGFRESLRRSRIGDGWLSHELVTPDGGRRSGEGRIDRARAKEMLAASDGSSFDWRPWPAK
jgi:uncharacterized protein DUF6226